MLRLAVLDEKDNVIGEKKGLDEVYLVYEGEYGEGNKILLSSDEKGLYEVKLDAALDNTVVYLDGEYILPIPFGEKKFCWPEISFCGSLHALSARKVPDKCLKNYRNLALNIYDHHENKALYPHSFANVETRGESVFASRNAMDGNFASSSHGKWPYESWGINRNPDAEMTVDFGRSVKLDRIVFYTRADFPHDAWWEYATIDFSNGESVTFPLKKKDGAQSFPVTLSSPVRSLVIKKLIKADDPSPFPALIQIEAWGTEA